LFDIDIGVPFNSRYREGGLKTGQGGQFPPQSTPFSPASTNPLEHLSITCGFSLHPKKMVNIVKAKAIRTFNVFDV
jgi:hypothetical protein